MNHRERIGCALFAIWTGVLALSGVAFGQASFTGLGVPEGEDSQSQAGQVSADGGTVAGSVREPLVVEEEEVDVISKAFIWTAAGGMTKLPVAGEIQSHRALGVSSNGATIVGVMTTFDEENAETSEIEQKPFRWTAAGGFQALPMPEGARQSSANAISWDGSTIVGYMDSADGFQAFRWSQADGTQGLGFFPDGLESRALAVNLDGSVIVGFGHHADGIRAFRWTAQDGLQNLGVTQGASKSWATGVSSDGSVVVGVVEFADTKTARAFRWTAQGGMVELTPMANTRSWLASAVSGDGGVIVGQRFGEDRTVEAFVWDATNGMRSVKAVLEAANVTVGDWRLDIAMGVSADGKTIVGAGVNPDGKGEAWRAVLP